MATIRTGVPASALRPPPGSAFEAYVDQPFGGLDDLLVVLDHDDRPAGVTQRE